MHLTCDLTRNSSNAIRRYISTRSRNNCYSRVNVLLTIFVLPAVIFLAVQEQNNLKNISNVLQTDTWKVEFSRQHLSSVRFSEMVGILKTYTSEVGSWGFDFVLKNYVSSSRKADVFEPRQNNVSYMGVDKLADAEKNRPSLLYPTYYSSGKDTSNYDFIDGQSGWELSSSTVRRRLSATRPEEVTELVEHGPEVIIKLENDAFKHSNLMDSAVLGKYNLWRREFESENSDLNVRLIRDQMILARVYLEIAKSKEKHDLYQELQAHLSGIRYTLGEAISDADLHPNASEKIKAMGRVLNKAKDQLHDCKTIGRKLRAMLQSADERVRSLKKQGSFLSQLAAKTIPNSIHCMSMRLTIDYNFLPSEKRQFPRSEKLEDPSLYHYALFSDNVLAASVVVNSTITNAKEPEKHVFHLVTDKLNFGAMSMWFLLNPPGNATIHVENIDDFHWLNSSLSPVLHQLESAATREYYFKSGHPSSISSGSSNLKYRNPKYLSMLNHLRFYLPRIYPKLDKILFLDDDIVVQKDLTGLWSVDLKGNVNGAVETCGESFHRFDKYLNFSNPQIAENFDPNACGWAYGMNIFDLNEWKKRDITGIYHKWQELNKDRALWKLGTLPPGLITFYGLTFSLDKSWHVLGLGYSPSIDPMEIQNAAVIHYNGNMKPWLGIAITKYKSYWTEYIKYDHPYLRNCDQSS